MIAGVVQASVHTVAKRVVAQLATNGVDVVFGIPGVHNQALYDALMDERSIRSIVTRHEQGAAFMADGFARSSGRVGVCFLISGPGVSNAATALGEAYADSSPVVALVTRYLSPPSERGRRLHDMRDQTSFLRSVTKETLRVTRSEEAAEIVETALGLAMEGRPGPVAVELPLELLDSQVEHDARAVPVLPQPGPAEVPAELLVALNSGRRPVIVVGGGASDAVAEVRKFAEKLQAPVVCTTAGKGIMPEGHPLAVGPWLRAAGVRDLIASADPLIMLGTEWSTTDIGEQPYPLPNSVVVVNYEADPRFVGYEVYRDDVANALATLTPRCSARVAGDVIDLVRDLKARARDEPRRWSVAAPYVAALRGSLEEDAVVTHDMNTLSYAAAELFEAYRPRTFLAPKGYGTLGFALPSALGARLARPDGQVVAVVGDGGFLFTAEELVTAVRYQLNVPIIVWNNHSYGAIRYTRLAAYGRTVDDDLINPDFVGFARACGASGLRVSSPEELAEAMQQALSYAGPTVIEIDAR